MARKKTNPPPIVIRRARMSFLWAEILPDLLEQRIPNASPYAFLTLRSTFSGMFKQICKATATTQRLEVPWLRDRRQQFWMRYLVQGILGDVSGNQAWEYFIPLRLADSGLRLQCDGFNDTIFADAFYYPFGVAAAVTLRWQTDLLLHDFAEKAWEICQTGGFSIRGELGTLSIGAVGDRILSTLRSSILGEKAVAGYQSPEPFTIVTVVEGLGPHPRADVKENDEVLRALEVVTNWPSDRKYFNLPDPGQVCLPLKQSAPPGSALYAQERGRAVWHPAMFRIENDANQAEQVDQNRRSSKLACYHRNLFFASLQTESLGRLITYTAREFASGRQKADLSDSHRNMAKNAALCLAKLYLGDKGNTWRSASMGRQIDQNFRKDLETVLAQFPVARLP